YEQRRPTGVVGGDLPAELGDASLQLGLGHHYGPEQRIARDVSRPPGLGAGARRRGGAHRAAHYRPPARSSRSLPRLRRTRTSPPTSQARAWPRATARTRSTASRSGGWGGQASSRSQRRMALRARGTGAPARDRASVGSSSAERLSS